MKEKEIMEDNEGMEKQEMKKKIKMSRRVILWMLKEILVFIVVFIFAIGFLYLDFNFIAEKKFALAALMTTLYIPMIYWLSVPPNNDIKDYMDSKVKEITKEYDTLDEFENSLKEEKE